MRPRSGAWASISRTDSPSGCSGASSCSGWMRADSGSLDLDLARSQLRAFGDPHRQDSVLESGLDLRAIQLAAQHETAPIERRAHIRVQGLGLLGQFELHTALEQRSEEHTPELQSQ